jgi:hypothetical protein
MMMGSARTRPKHSVRRTARSPRARLLPQSNLPKVIPPRSVVILRSYDPETTPEWKEDRGRMFRVGYYNRNDGLDCIWLVNERGEYEQTTDRASLLKHFLILKLSGEQDLFGDQRPPLKPTDRSGSPLLAARAG